MSSAVLVRVCVMLVSHRIASVQNSEIEKPVSEENLFVLSIACGTQTKICKTRLHEFAPICQVNQKLESSGCELWMWGGARYL